MESVAVNKFNSNLIDRNTIYRQLPDRDGIPAYRQEERRVIVCLCGSTRFWREFQEASLRETLDGKIVLTIGAARCADGGDKSFGGYIPVDMFDTVKTALDLLHCDKIDLADEVFVLNVGGYVGDSTRREVLHAAKQHKRVRWHEPFKVPPDLAHIGDSLSEGPCIAIATTTRITEAHKAARREGTFQTRSAACLLAQCLHQKTGLHCWAQTTTAALRRRFAIRNPPGCGRRVTRV
jgi:hypothetical protein